MSSIRHRKPGFAMALIVPAILLANASWAQTQTKRPISVETSVSSTEVAAGETFEVHARFTLTPGVHVYKKKISFKWDGTEGATPGDALFPPAKRIPDILQPGQTVEVYEESADVPVRFVAGGKPGEPIVIKGSVAYQGCTDKVCFRPRKHRFEHAIKIVPSRDARPEAASEEPVLPQSESANLTEAVPDDGAAKDAEESLAGMLLRILGAFLAGIAISLTPCVYPMIPITAAIVAGTGEGEERSVRKALGGSIVYILGLSLTYSVLGVLVAKFGGTVNAVLRSAFLLVPIAGVFVLLALSMFDVFVIQTPTRIASRLQGSATGYSGRIGIFFMGLVSGVVASPCVAAPLAGVLLYIARQGNVILGFWMLFALAWGMGLVLVVAGTFTGMLPKAGRWMEWIKRLFGFVMLWAAAYFLKALIGEAAYYVLAGLVILAGVVFLGGLDTLTAESGFGPRMIRLVGLVALLLGGGMVAVGGTRLLGWTAHSGVSSQSQSAQTPFKRGGEREFEAALESGKPVILDFYADWCTICKELDHKTFSDPKVREALARFVALKIDIDAEPALAKRLNVIDPPYIAFFDSDGAERKSLHFYGFKKADDLLQILEKTR